MTTPIERMIDAAVRCLCCGRQGMGNCRCWAEWMPRCETCRCCLQHCACPVEWPEGLPARLKRHPTDTSRGYLLRCVAQAAILRMREAGRGGHYPEPDTVQPYTLHGWRVTLWGENGTSVPRITAGRVGEEWELGWGASSPVSPRVVG